MNGWERVKSSKVRFGGRHSPLGGDERRSSRTVRLGRVQPQAPTHRTIYCNDREANLPVRFKVRPIITNGLMLQFIFVSGNLEVLGLRNGDLLAFLIWDPWRPHETGISLN